MKNIYYVYGYTFKKLPENVVKEAGEKVFYKIFKSKEVDIDSTLYKKIKNKNDSIELEDKYFNKKNLIVIKYLKNPKYALVLLKHGKIIDYLGECGNDTAYTDSFGKRLKIGDVISIQQKGSIKKFFEFVVPFQQGYFDSMYKLIFSVYFDDAKDGTVVIKKEKSYYFVKENESIGSVKKVLIKKKERGGL